jgi:hypothetical protein
MSTSLRVLRTYANAAGESCFNTYEIQRGLRNFAPPAAPLFASEIAEASGYTVLRLPVGWIGERHLSPKRQILFCLSGRVRITPDVGNPQIIAAGDAWMMEDTEGSGHKTEVISEEPFDAVVIQIS